MDENITHALSMVGSVILFIFALSCAIYSYENLETRTEFFFEVHNITARQGDATTQLLDESEIQRKVGFEEILLGVVDMPRYASTAGNNSNTKIKIKSDIGEFLFSVVPETDPTTMEIKYLIANGSDRYDVNNEDDLRKLTANIITYTLGENPGSVSTNNILSNANVINNSREITFSISYDEESIVYKQNPIEWKELV